jgi:UDP-N-acetylglucosamine--N-acetylmuramyl-(pentapeptide) pyrophosphoryl-undecaprenol N-acetylglucosamine transferase
VRDAVRARAGAPPPGEGGALSLLAFGGSQGASAFSALIPAAVAALPAEMRARLSVAQQAREGEAAAVAGSYAKSGIRAEVAPFFDDMPERLAAAHLVVCRAGASTVAELAAIGRPAVLIPFPAAMDDHQTANARALAEAGAAVLAPEAGLTPAALSAHLAALLGDPLLRARMADAARGQGRPEAAGTLAALVETLASGRPPA